MIQIIIFIDNINKHIGNVSKSPTSSGLQKNKRGWYSIPKVNVSVESRITLNETCSNNRYSLDIDADGENRFYPVYTGYMNVIVMPGSFSFG